MTNSTNEPGPVISAHADPQGQVPWVMQLVIHVEKTSPPTRTDACTAAAQAVVWLLAQPQAQPGGLWSPQLQRWLDGRIRKHVRRARGAAWDKAQELDGVTVTTGSASVRAFVPCPTDQIPRELGRLQLSGTELDDPTAVRDYLPTPDGAVVVSLTPTPVLGVGKAAAAAGHAAQLAASSMLAPRYASWASAGFPVVVEQPRSELWARRRTEAMVEVIDAGFTEVDPGTCTSIARWK